MDGLLSIGGRGGATPLIQEMGLVQEMGGPPPAGGGGGRPLIQEVGRGSAPGIPSPPPPPGWAAPPPGGGGAPPMLPEQFEAELAALLKSYADAGMDPEKVCV